MDEEPKVHMMHSTRLVISTPGIARVTAVSERSSTLPTYAIFVHVDVTVAMRTVRAARRRWLAG